MDRDLRRPGSELKAVAAAQRLAVVDAGGHLLTFARKEDDIRANFAAIMKGQSDPKEMIDKMVEVIAKDDGLYRNVWPPSTETLIKQVQERAWTLRSGGGS